MASSSLSALVPALVEYSTRARIRLHVGVPNAHLAGRAAVVSAGSGGSPVPLPTPVAAAAAEASKVPTVPRAPPAAPPPARTIAAGWEEEAATVRAAADLALRLSA